MTNEQGQDPAPPGGPGQAGGGEAVSFGFGHQLGNTRHKCVWFGFLTVGATANIGGLMNEARGLTGS